MKNVDYTTTTCDLCNFRAPCRVYHTIGVPVLAQCRHCDPEAYEALVRVEIDASLEGK